MHKNRDFPSLKKTVPSVDAAKRQADRLMARLESLGITIKRTQALEAVAAIHEAPDWNTHLASLISGSQEPAQRSHAVAVIPVGQGKVLSMAVLMIDAMRRGTVPLFIDCSAGRSSQHLPDAITDRAHRIDWSMDSISAPPPSKDARCVVVNLLGSSPFEDFSLEQKIKRARAFSNLVNSIRSDWPEAAIGNMDSVFINELSHLEIDAHLDASIRKSLKELSGMANLLIADQAHSPEIAKCIEPCRVIMVNDSAADPSVLSQWACEIKRVFWTPQKVHDFANRETLVEDVFACIAQTILTLSGKSLSHIRGPFKEIFSMVLQDQKAKHRTASKIQAP
jgi:hypothetical protein